MPETLQFPSLPQLTWNGGQWVAQTTIPALPGGEPVELIVRVPYSSDLEQKDVRTAPPLAAPQVAAFQHLLTHGTKVWASIVAAMRQYDTDNEIFAEDGSVSDLECGSVIIHTVAWDEVAYIGCQFYSLDTWVSEHGLGIIVHRDRVVHVGMAKEANDERAIAKDIRRLKREQSVAQKNK